MRQRPDSPNQAELATFRGSPSAPAADRSPAEFHDSPRTVAPAHRDGWVRLRFASYLTVGVTYLLIIMGAVVRVSGSGLGCPDWPLCHGQVVPPGHTAGIIEYSHRLLAGIDGLLILATLILWARAHRFSSRILMAAAGVLLLLAVQVGIGAAVVNLELPPMLVLVHLGMAMLLFGLLIAIAVHSGAPLGAGPRGGGHALPDLRNRPNGDVHENYPTNNPEASASPRFLRLAAAATAAVYLLLLAGAYVRASGSSGACFGFPTCNGAWLPFGSARSVDIHLFHRLLAYAVSAHLLVTLVRAWRFERNVPLLPAATALVGIALVAQLAIGAAAVSMGIPPITQILHVAGATALWGATVWLLTLALRSRGLLGSRLS